MKCIECDKIKYEIDKTGHCKARCTLQTPPQKGKIITWASTTVILSPITFPRQHGYSRVFEELEKKKKAPKWCPLTKKVDE
jgi:hypothetical protein